MSSTGGQIETLIRNKLHKTLQATHLEIINESHLHNAPVGAETHFKIVVVSKKFEDLTSLKRHRLINDTLRDEMRINIRALAIVAKTPEQWAAGEEAGDTSPKRRASFGIPSSHAGDVEIARWP